MAPAGWAASPAREQRLRSAFPHRLSISGPAAVSPRAMLSREHRSRCEAGSGGEDSEHARRQGERCSVPVGDGDITGAGWRRAVK